jgi:WD40 repeat protein
MPEHQGHPLIILLLASVAFLLTRTDRTAAGPKKTAEQQKAASTDRYGDLLPEGAIARLGTVRLRHGSDIWSIAFSPDGKILASGGGDNTIRFWSPATGKEIRRFRGHQDWVLCIAFSPDGKTLVSGSRDKTVRLWDRATGNELRRLTKHKSEVHLVIFAPDGKFLASADHRHDADRANHTGTARIWDLETGKEVKSFHTEYGFESLAFIQGNKLLASLEEFSIHVLELAQGKKVRKFQGHTGIVCCLAVSPKGTLLASGSQDKTVRLWNLASGKEVRTLTRHRRTVRAVAFSPNGRTLVSQGDDGLIYFWNARTGKLMRVIRGPGGGLQGLAFSPNGKMLASADNGIHLWHTNTGKEILPRDGHFGAVQSVAFSPDGKTLASAGWDRTVRLWDLNSSKEVRRFGNNNSRMRAVTFSKDGKSLAAGGEGGLRLWQITTGRQNRRYWGGSIDFLAFALGGKALVWGDIYQGITLQWLEKEKEYHQLSRGTGDFLTGSILTLSPDGKTVVSPLAFWDLTTGAKRKWPVPPKPRTGYLAYAPNGKLLASLDERGVMQLWEVSTGKLISERKGRWGLLVFSPDGKTLAMRGADFSISLVELATGKELCRFRGHAGSVTSASFSPDAKLLATSSEDTTILVWDVSGLRRERHLSRVRPASQKLDQWWKGLDSPNPAKAYAAIWQLVDAPDHAPSFLLGQLSPSFRRDDEQIRQLIAKLDARRFATRRRASRDLKRLGDLAEPALHKALASQPSPEAGRRLRHLMKPLLKTRFTRQRRRALRVVEILEYIGTREARRALQTVRKEAPGTWVQQDAQEALDRLAKRGADRR